MMERVEDVPRVVDTHTLAEVTHLERGAEWCPLTKAGAKSFT